MKKLVETLGMGALAVALTLAAVTLLVQASIRIALLPGLALRVFAVVAELVLGVALLLGVTYVATRIAVRLFAGPSARSSEEGPEP